MKLKYVGTDNNNNNNFKYNIHCKISFTISITRHVFNQAL